MTRKSSDISAGSTLQVARIRDEDTPVTEELNKYWKRIADLETRVHDLTLQSTMVSMKTPFSKIVFFVETNAVFELIRGKVLATH